MWGRLDGIASSDVFGLWIRLALLSIVISLVIDVVDVIRYIAGDRESAIELRGHHHLG